jgi:hypothetical protein
MIIKDRNLEITFRSDPLNDFLIKIIRIDNDNLPNSQVEDVTLRGSMKVFDVADVGTNYREIVLVVSVLQTTKEPIPYSFSVSLISCAETALG